MENFSYLFSFPSKISLLSILVPASYEKDINQELRTKDELNDE